MTYLERIKDLYQMIDQDKMQEAFEKYYHEDMVQVEATGEERRGKAVGRQSLKDWENMIAEFHGGGHGIITSNEADATTAVESWAEVTFKDHGRMKIEEVAVQKWEGDQIIHERFYYNAPPQP